jgi:hypothetical protein
MSGGISGASGPGYSVGLRFGWFVALIGALAVAVGGYLKKADPQPVAAAGPTYPAQQYPPQTPPQQYPPQQTPPQQYPPQGPPPQGPPPG